LHSETQSSSLLQDIEALASALANERQRAAKEVQALQAKLIATSERCMHAEASKAEAEVAVVQDMQALKAELEIERTRALDAATSLQAERERCLAAQAASTEAEKAAAQLRGTVQKRDQD
jgi:septum formation topological specificity factor MinE